jgi:hypothetical protein
MYKFFAALFFITFTGSLSAQFQVDTTVTAEELVFDFLLGSGVLIENPQVSGSSVQYGSFTGDTVLGLDSGLVMSSAGAMNIALESGGYDVPWDEGLSDDPDLLALANSVPPLIGQNFNVSGVYNVMAIEFDFIPYGDSLTFNYVFGSDEYLEWVNSSFNDVFGFFVSGPGIEGPYSSPAEFPGGSINIAVVPDSDPPLPITVSSVNDQTNSELYIDNVANDDISIDGYTQVLTAHLNGLEVGETYHIRLAIADGTDTALESVVMLQGGSFSAYVTTEPAGPGDLDEDGDLDVEDLLLLLSQQGCEGVDCIGDLNEDGITNVMDILFFLGLF